jgi:hypothetical protein
MRRKTRMSTGLSLGLVGIVVFFLLVWVVATILAL